MGHKDKDQELKVSLGYIVRGQPGIHEGKNKKDTVKDSKTTISPPSPQTPTAGYAVITAVRQLRLGG